MEFSLEVIGAIIGEIIAILVIVYFGFWYYKKNPLSVIRVIITSATVLQAVVLYLIFYYFLDCFVDTLWYITSVVVMLMILVFVLLCSSTVKIWMHDKF